MSTTVTKWFARWESGLTWCSAECRVTNRQVRIVRVLSSSGDAPEVDFRVGRNWHPATRYISIVGPREAFDSLDAALCAVATELERKCEGLERDARDMRLGAQEVERARREVSR